jgi:ABC-2 type transport system permease protein
MAAPGTFRWLLRHELRLMYRDARGKVASSLGALLVFILLHVLAVPLALGVQVSIRMSDTLPLAMVSGLAGLTLLTLWARALTLSVQTLYERGDVELLVSSPLPPRAWFAVRASAIALRSTAEYGLLLVPVANVFIAFGQLRWLLVYVSVPLGALLATSAALWLALGLLRLLGPRRTRLFAQIFAALIGVGAALIVQLPSLYGYDDDASLAAFARFSRLPGAASAVWLPARVAMGKSLWAPVVGLGCVAAFVLSVRLLAAPFIEGLTLAAHADVRRPRSSTKLPRFGGSARTALVRKELRVALRDPWLMTQLLQQNLFLLPATLMFVRWDLHGVSVAWLAIVMCAGTSASAFGWLASSGEEAPELIGSAPISVLERLIAQLIASLVPVVSAICVACAVLCFFHPYAALVIGLCSLGNAFCNAFFNVRLKRPAKRHEFRRRNQANLPGLLAELALMSVWVTLGVVLLAITG